MVEDVLVYSHSPEQLYSFNPETLRVTEIGSFRTAGGMTVGPMIDLAVNSLGEIYTTSAESLFRVNPETAVAEPVGSGLGLDRDEQLVALTFLTAGTLMAGVEDLIGATSGGSYYRLNTTTGAPTRLGNFPSGWRASGDLVSVERLGTYATLRTEANDGDTLARIDFAADGSSSVSVIGRVTVDGMPVLRIFGLAYWGRTVYGFTNDGWLISIDRDTGAASRVSVDTGAEQFWGAGVSTKAPVLI
jgi:outer membrane protein assembly factor BamB